MGNIDNMARSIALGVDRKSKYKCEKPAVEWNKPSFTFTFSKAQTNADQIHIRVSGTAAQGDAWSFTPIIASGTQYQSTTPIAVTIPSGGAIIVDIVLERKGEIFCVTAWQNDETTPLARYTTTLGENGLTSGKWGRVLWTTDASALGTDGEVIASYR